MSYRTTCPQCASVFRIGATQLAAAAGWAQCGVCGAAFDARASLRMEDGSPLPSPDEAPVPPGAPGSEAPVEGAAAPEPAADIAATSDEVSAGESAPDEAPGAATAEAQAPGDGAGSVVPPEPTHELDSIILIDPDAAPPDDPGPLPQIPAAGASYPPPAPGAPSPRAPAVTRPAVEPRNTAVSAASEYAQPPAAARRRTAPGKTSRRWIWAAASVVLFAALLAQSAFFLRDTLVGRLPQTRAAFERMCAALGCTLALPKNLALLQIVGSDLQTEAGDGLALALTLGNRANHVQAWPVLVVTLTDQRDRPLTRRSFAPSEYLADPARIAAGIAPRSEEALSLPLSVRGPAPMGFDLRLAY